MISEERFIRRMGRYGVQGSVVRRATAWSLVAGHLRYHHAQLRRGLRDAAVLVTPVKFLLAIWISGWFLVALAAMVVATYHIVEAYLRGQDLDGFGELQTNVENPAMEWRALVRAARPREARVYVCSADCVRPVFMVKAGESWFACACTADTMAKILY